MGRQVNTTLKSVLGEKRFTRFADWTRSKPEAVRQLTLLFEYAWESRPHVGVRSSFEYKTAFGKVMEGYLERANYDFERTCQLVSGDFGINGC